MKTLDKFEADIIAFALGTVAVLVLVAAFAMGAFAQLPQAPGTCVTKCYRACDRYGLCHLECTTVCR